MEYKPDDNELSNYLASEIFNWQFSPLAHPNFVDYGKL